MKHLRRTITAALILALLAASAYAATNDKTVEFIKAMENNTLVANVDGASETFTLERYDNWSNSPSMTFSRKDVRNAYLDSVRIFVCYTPYVGNVINTTFSDLVDYGSGTVSYTNYQNGKPKTYEASFRPELSGGTSYDDFFNNSYTYAVVEPNANAYYQLTFDYMSDDGRTMGGTIEAVLINGQNGGKVVLSDGYFKYTPR